MAATPTMTTDELIAKVLDTIVDGDYEERVSMLNLVEQLCGWQARMELEERLAK